MVCRSAYLIRTPVVEKITEQYVSYFNHQTKKWEHYYQAMLVPEYKVSLTYDFGACCGVDGHEEKFTSEEDAQALIDKIYRSEHWIRYDPEYIEEDDD